MRALALKAWRDLLHLRGQAVAISLILASGVAIAVMSFCALDSLRWSRETWLARARFADAFASVVRAPLPLASRLADVPGVTSVETRIVKDVTLDVRGLVEPATGRLISMDEGPPRGLDRIHLRRGRWLEAGGADEVLVNEAFAEAHGLRPGDAVLAVVNGRRRRLALVGVVLSPEYVYAFRPGDVLPDDRRFGVFWASRRDLAAAFDMDGAFNDVALDLAPDASVPEVLRRIDLLTEPYGGTGAYAREDQPSYRMITDELSQLRAMATVPPAIFLAVAAFLLHVATARIVGRQREQIAALRAFGYRRREIATHYLVPALGIAGAGATLGVLVGAWLGRGLTRNYARFFRFPEFDVRLEPDTVLLALAVSAGAALLGVLGAVRRATSLPPAEAMRPEPPARFGPTLLERVGLGRLLSPGARMVLRQMERRPVRTLLSALAIAFGAAVMVLGGFVGDTVDHVIDLRFHRTDRSDAQVNLVEASSARALEDLAHLPGVRHAEPLRDVPVRLRSGPRSRRAVVHGIREDGRLFRLHDERGRPVTLPPRGVVLSERLATRLALSAGDVLTVEVLEGRRPRLRVPVVSVLPDVAGATAYARIEVVHDLLGEGDSLTGALLDVDESRRADFYRAVKDAPRVAGAVVKDALLASFRSTFAENLLRMQLATLVFAVVLAAGVVYDAARTSLAERARDLATLRVVGFSRGEVSAILLGELALLALVAVPAGLWIGRAFAGVSLEAMSTSDYRFPLVVDRSTYALAAAVTFGAALLSALHVRRRIDRLDLVGVLRAPE